MTDNIPDPLRALTTELASEPWYEMLMDYYQNRSNHDDEQTMELIWQTFEKSLSVLGITRSINRDTMEAKFEELYRR